MPITAITIENFKGIREPVRVELKPITLLFGPNSAGKSSIVQALHYAREILEKQNVNPDRTIAGGQSLDLGGFLNLVHGHDESREISLRFDIDVGDIDLSELLPNPYDNGKTDEISGRLCVVKTAWIKISMQWNKWLNKAVVNRYEVGIDGQIFVEICSSETYNKIGITLYDHKYLCQNDILEWRTERAIEEYTQNEPEPEDAPEPVYLEWNDDLQEDHSDSYDDMEPGDHEDDVTFEEHSENANHDLQEEAISPFFEYGLRQKEVLPDWNKLLIMEGSVQDQFDWYQAPHFQRLVSILTICPGKIVKDELEKFKYVGPLRAVPERSHRPQLTEDKSRWADGLAAWDVLVDSSSDLIDELNKWMVREDRLNTGYTVYVKKFKELEIDSSIMVAISKGTLLDEQSLKSEIDKLPIQTRIFLRDYSRLEFQPQDVGIGIAQVLPIIVLSLYAKNGLVTIEQPELHIHPAIQVSLGDLFIEEITRKENLKFLIETHSEHLLLRFLRRIRETNDGELPVGKIGLNPESLSIYFAEQGKDGIRCTPIRVSNEGEFMDRWPRGFFDERIKELY